MHNTPTATRTGIVIGSAYQPRHTARYADPLEHHVTRRGSKAVLWICLLALVSVAVLVGAGQ